MEENQKIERNLKIDNRRKIIFNFVAIVCIVLFCMANSPKVLQNDTFYTIKVGEYIAQNGIKNLTTDVFSWHELPYTYPHWLYDLGIYTIYNNFGQTGIYFSTMIFYSILGISVYILCNKKSKNMIVSFALTVGAMYLVEPYVAARAQLVTFILFVWTVYCIEKFLETHKIRYAIFLVIIPLIITNLHCAVFPFYFVLYLPYIAEYFLILLENVDLDRRVLSLILIILKKVSYKAENKEKYDKKIERLKEDISERKRKRVILRENPYRIKVKKNNYIWLLIIIMAISALTGFLNPAGNGAYTYLYKTMKGNTTSSINEHLPLTLYDDKKFAITLVIFIAILIFTDTKIKLADLFMFSGLVFLTFKSRRQESMYLLFCTPILATMISDFFEKYDKNTCKKILKFFSGWFGATVLVCVFILVSIKIVKPKLKEDYIDSNSYPVEPSKWILANLDIENMKLFNEYNYGSYLLFEGIPVFIDSRCDLYSPEFNEDIENGIEGRDIFSDTLNIDNLSVDYNSKFEEYGVTHIILYADSKLAMIMEKDSGYKLLYNANNFKIFERIEK